jgi:hypothetical protein
MTDPPGEEPTAVLIGDPDGNVVEIRGPVYRWTDGYPFVDFTVKLKSEQMCASRIVRIANTPTMNVAGFFAELADDWRGVTPRRTWQSLEHEMSIDVERDSFGHLFLPFTLRDHRDRRSEWEASVTVDVEAGEQADRLRRDLDAFFRA